MKHQDKLKDFSFEQLFYDSLGIEHLTIALENTNRIKMLDLSENDLGSKNFRILLKIFHKNNEIELLNVADCKVIVSFNTISLMEIVLFNCAVFYRIMRL